MIAHRWANPDQSRELLFVIVAIAFPSSQVTLPVSRKSSSCFPGQCLLKACHWFTGVLALKLVVLLIASTSFSGDVFSGSYFAQAQFFL